MHFSRAARPDIFRSPGAARAREGGDAENVVLTPQAEGSFRRSRRSPSPQSEQKLATVLDLIDDSLQALESTPILAGARRGKRETPSSAHARGENGLGASTMGGHDTKGTEQYVNVLTAQLLKAQRENKVLEAENRKLLRTINSSRQKGTTSALNMGMDLSTSMLQPQDDTKLNFSNDDSSMPAIKDLITKIHGHVNRRSFAFAQSRSTGMCSLPHSDAQKSLDRLRMALQGIQNAKIANSDGLARLASTSRQDKDKLHSLQFEMEQLQNEKRDLEDQVLAFEAENMRLTNQLDEQKYMARQSHGSPSPATGNTALHEHIAKLTTEKLVLQQQNNALEERCQRLINEIDDLRLGEVAASGSNAKDTPVKTTSENASHQGMEMVNPAALLAAATS
eukprot:g1905.t1